MSALLGALLWSLFLLLSVLLYAKEEKRVAAELAGLCRLLFYLKSEIDCYLRPLPLIFASFEDEALEACGFLSVLRQEGLSAALCSGTLHLKPRDLSPLFPFSASLGTRLLCEERIALEDTLRQMQAQKEEQTRMAPRRRRLHATLFLSGGMLLLLLFI